MDDELKRDCVDDENKRYGDVLWRNGEKEESDV